MACIEEKGGMQWILFSRGAGPWCRMCTGCSQNLRLREAPRPLSYVTRVQLCLGECGDLGVAADGGSQLPAISLVGPKGFGIQGGVVSRTVELMRQHDGGQMGTGAVR